VGELAAIGVIPQRPFFGTADATPLFCWLLGEHAVRTGRLDLLQELGPALDAALAWIDRRLDADPRGFLSYGHSGEDPIVNEGWKDSPDAIVHADGSLAQPPISLVEVQGEVFAAWNTIARARDELGEHDRAEALRRKAEAFQSRFQDHFWVDRLGTYALGLDGKGRPLEVVASNAGLALWSGIVPAAHAGRVADALMDPTMFSGWGVRTLSATERRYNPIGYHLGTVWPHDNSLIALGLRRYGRVGDADRIAQGIIEAASYENEQRLPEVFAGYDRDAFPIPVRYPVACHPQAWAAGSIPALVAAMCGLRIDAFRHELRLVRPALPAFVGSLDLTGIRVGTATCDLHFEQRGGRLSAEVDRLDGELDVLVEQPLARVD
jgi:glycogen debranching enzyme